jgi:hypothetical protein
MTALATAGPRADDVLDLRHPARRVTRDQFGSERESGAADAGTRVRRDAPGVYADLFDDDLDTVLASLNAARNAPIAR